VVGAETTPHGWSQSTSKIRHSAGPHTDGPHGENPPASHRDCNVATCKSRNFVIISTEVRTISPFQKVLHSRCIGPSSQDQALLWVLGHQVFWQLRVRGHPYSPN